MTDPAELARCMDMLSEVPTQMPLILGIMGLIMLAGQTCMRTESISSSLLDRLLV